MIHRTIFIKVLLAVFLLTPSLSAKAEHNEEKFNPGVFILDHMSDTYDWHILTYNGHHVSVPLPVILFSKQSGFHIFMSSKFHHGHSSYKGFSIASDGDFIGKIVEQSADGSFIRPALDISITKTVFALLVSIAIILTIFISVAKAYNRRGNVAPSGLQSMMEPLILFVRDDIARPTLGHKYKQHMPYLLTVFFFILINNVMGLIPFFPFGANVVGNIAVALVLAIITFVISIVISTKKYWLHIINPPEVPVWLKIPVPLMPFVEVLGVITKPVVLMIRMFANITGGHIVMLGLLSLIFLFANLSIIAGYGVSVVSVLLVVFMSLLELLVAFIQAFVFTLLSALYFSMASEEHH